MGSRSGDSTGEAPRRVASARLVFHSGIVRLDDPRITPAPEGYAERVWPRPGGPSGAAEHSADGAAPK